MQFILIFTRLLKKRRMIIKDEKKSALVLISVSVALNVVFNKMIHLYNIFTQNKLLRA